MVDVYSNEQTNLRRRIEADCIGCNRQNQGTNDLTTLSLNELLELRDAVADICGFFTDNSCSDPDCCGGPFYTDEDYQHGSEILAKYGLAPVSG
jgi:hypothetical protein